MGNFIKAFRHFKDLRKYSHSYRLCWIPYGDNGIGIWSVIEIFDEELNKIDPIKCEIVFK